MKSLLILSLFSACLSASLAAAERDALPRPNWSRDTAALASEQPGTRDTLARLYALVRAGRGDALLQAVIAIDGDRSRPEPERDRILFELAAALGDFEPGAIGPETLEYLRDRPTRTRVPHEERPGMGVPMYNVRAAAAGSLAAWKRRDASPGRRPDHAATAQYLDAESFLEFISSPRRTGMADHVRTAGDRLDPAELEAVVLAAPGLADAATASLLIGELAPRVIDRPAVTEALFALLGHAELGAGAALVLGGSGDEAVLLQLAEQADSDDGLAARRASLAIDRYLAAERDR